jgi:dTDP-4-amino-4,6-dideoxygalactose transaminase
MLPIVKVSLPPKEILMKELENVLYSGMIAEGEAVYQFEEQFAANFGLPFALAMSSGTAALHAALVHCNVSVGDEVITTSMTAEPTNVAILQVGAIPVFADVDPSSGNLDPFSIEQKITPKTKAIMVVHYAGIPARMKEIRVIADKFNLPIIEDCAHALGALYAGEGIGNVGYFAIYSLQAIKHMTTVDGGMLVCKNKELIPNLKKFRWFGLQKGVPRTEVDITSIGYKYNMNNVTATFGLVQLKTIRERVIDLHIQNGRFFDDAISKIPGLSVATFDEFSDPSYWLYTILSDDSDNVERLLASVQVSASKLHRPNHLHSIFKPFTNGLPQLDIYYKRMIHIPCGWWVTPEIREQIVETLKRG